MECTGNNSFGKHDNKLKVLVIGASNSIIKGGWYEQFKKDYDDIFDILNISLGACTSVYIAYQMNRNMNLFLEADVVILEPFVNDVSHLPNKQVSKSNLFAAIDYIYQFCAYIEKLTIALILPTEKRLSNYKGNMVYKKHMENISKHNIFSLDFHPQFSLANVDTSKYFLDPAHIDLQFAQHLGTKLGELINSAVLEKPLVSEKPDIRYVEIFPKSRRVQKKESSKFSANLRTITDSYHVEAREGMVLCGILHWNEVNNLSIFVKANDEVFRWDFSSKFLKLSSPPLDVTGSFSLSSDEIENFKVYSFIFREKREITNVDKSVVKIDRGNSRNTQDYLVTDLVFNSFGKQSAHLTESLNIY